MAFFRYAVGCYSFRCVVNGYQDCRYDGREDEIYDFLKKIGKKDCAHGRQLGHLRRELVASLWPANALITC